MNLKIEQYDNDELLDMVQALDDKDTARMAALPVQEHVARVLKCAHARKLIKRDTAVRIAVLWRIPIKRHKHEN